MITIKIFNVVHQGRSNQNTTFTIWEKDLKYSANVTEEELLKDLQNIKPIDVEIQKNTSLKIIYRRV